MIARNITRYWNILHFNFFKLETFISKSILRPVLVFIRSKDGKEYYEESELDLQEEGIIDELANPLDISNRIIADTAMFFLAFMLHYAAINVFLAVVDQSMGKTMLIAIAVVGAVIFNYEVLYKDYRFLDHQFVLGKASTSRKKWYMALTTISVLVIFSITAFSSLL